MPISRLVSQLPELHHASEYFESRSLDIKLTSHIYISPCYSSGACSPFPSIVQVKHYIVTTTGDPAVDATDVVDRGWAKLWCEFMDREADGHRPPDTVVGVASLAKKDILYECEVWAIVHE